MSRPATPPILRPGSAATRGEKPALSPARAGGGAVALGAAGVVATSIFYSMSPRAAALPLAPLELAAAAEGAVRGQWTMWLAGVIGILGDVAIAGGGLLLGADRMSRGDGPAALAWFLIAVAAILFAVVDALVGFVLPPVAAAGGASPSFLASKALFDALFMLGTATFGIGASLAVLYDGRARARIPRIVSAAGLVAGLAAAAGGLGALFGQNLPDLMGFGILGGSAVFAVIGLALAARSPDRPR